MGKWDIAIKIGKVTLPLIGFAAGQVLGAIQNKEMTKTIENKSTEAAKKAVEEFLKK